MTELEDLKIFPLIHSAREDEPWDLMKDPRMWVKRDVKIQAIVIFDVNGRPMHKNWVYRGSEIADGTILAKSHWAFIDDPNTGIFIVRSRELSYIKGDDTETERIQGVYDVYNPADLAIYQEHMRTLSVNERTWGRQHILDDLKIVILGVMPAIYPNETSDEHVARGGALWKEIGPELGEFVETGARSVTGKIQGLDPSGEFSWLDAASGFPNETIRQYMIRRIDY